MLARVWVTFRISQITSPAYRYFSRELTGSHIQDERSCPGDFLKPIWQIVKARPVTKMLPGKLLRFEVCPARPNQLRRRAHCMPASRPPAPDLLPPSAPSALRALAHAAPPRRPSREETCRRVWCSFGSQLKARIFLRPGGAGSLAQTGPTQARPAIRPYRRYIVDMANSDWQISSRPRRGRLGPEGATLGSTGAPSGPKGAPSGPG